MNRPADSAIDRAALAALVRRFRHLHEQRLERTGSRLLDRQRRVLEALPMLYHRNHPALPGYTGPDVPCGISRFQPDRRHLAALQRVARSFEDPRLPAANADIQAIFIMGSSGTVAQGRGSDIDLWVCCDSLLHSALWPKVRLIDQWAAELGLELHSFLVDPEVLRLRQRLPGTRTPALLLDEFYRSGALMAGRYPLWWLVADDDPAGYTAAARHLLSRRFVDAESVIDFGPVPAFAPDELAQAVITDLDRALTTPHKSLLKLKLMEAYARAPELGTVSATYKARVHAGESDPLRLDPYLLLYDHVQRYLERRGRHDELEFVRGLLLGKAAENARSAGLRDSPGDERALHQRFLDWGFSRADIERFRSLDRWSMSERVAENENIMSALVSGLDLVQTLVDEATAIPGAGAGASPEGEDWKQLHWLNETRLRHLRTAVTGLCSADPRDVPLLHPALVSRRRLATLRVHRGSDGWIATDDHGVVLRRRRLVELVVWTELNGAQLLPLRPDANLTRNLAQILQGFRGPTRTTHVFANAQAGDSQGTGDSLASLLTLRQEPLRYVGAHRLPLASLDIVSRAASGHWRVTTVDDLANIEAIAPLLAMEPDAVCWHVIGANDRFVTARRLEELHALARRVLATPGELFALPVADAIVTLRQRSSGLEILRHNSLPELQAYARTTGCTIHGADPNHQGPAQRAG